MAVERFRLRVVLVVSGNLPNRDGRLSSSRHHYEIVGSHVVDEADDLASPVAQCPLGLAGAAGRRMSFTCLRLEMSFRRHFSLGKEEAAVGEVCVCRAVVTTLIDPRIP